MPIARVLQPLDQAEHGTQLGRLRHLPQPGEPAQAALLPAPGQRIEALALLGGEPVRQPAMRLSARTVAELGAQPLERGKRWDDDAAGTARLHHQVGQEGEPVILDRLRQQCVGQLGRGAPAEGRNPSFS